MFGPPTTAPATPPTMAPGGPAIAAPAPAPMATPSTVPACASAAEPSSIAVINPVFRVVRIAFLLGLLRRDNAGRGRVFLTAFDDGKTPPPSSLSRRPPAAGPR